MRGARNHIMGRGTRDETDTDSLQKAVVRRVEHNRLRSDERRNSDTLSTEMREAWHRLETHDLPKQSREALRARLDEPVRRFNATE